jgi:hypothetical protein
MASAVLLVPGGDELDDLAPSPYRTGGERLLAYLRRDTGQRDGEGRGKGVALITFEDRLDAANPDAVSAEVADVPGSSEVGSSE